MVHRETIIQLRQKRMPVVLVNLSKNHSRNNSNNHSKIVGQMKTHKNQQTVQAHIRIIAATMEIEINHDVMVIKQMVETEVLMLAQVIMVQLQRHQNHLMKIMQAAKKL